MEYLKLNIQDDIHEEKRNIYDIEKGAENCIGIYKVESSVIIKTETEKAIMIDCSHIEHNPQNALNLGSFNNKEKKLLRNAWFPKSQIKIVKTENEFVIFIPKWMIEKANMQMFVLSQTFTQEDVDNYEISNGLIE